MGRRVGDGSVCWRTLCRIVVRRRDILGGLTAKDRFWILNICRKRWALRACGNTLGIHDAESLEEGVFRCRIVI